MNKLLGRPQISQTTKEILLRKLEPYLNTGYSLRKACREAKVNRAWVYTLIQRDGDFADQITAAKEYLGVYFHTFVFRIISGYCFRILSGEQLQSYELDFLKWFAVHSNIMTGEFGVQTRPIFVIDPELEIRRLKLILAKNCPLRS